jgi:hypothetical protein
VRNAKPGRSTNESTAANRRILLSPGAQTGRQSKPPPPEPTPGPLIYPTLVSLGELGDIWVSLPKPDRLTIIGVVLPKHFTAGVSPQDPYGYAQIVMQAAASGQLGKITGKPKYYAGKFFEVQIVTPSGGAVNFTVAKAKNPEAANTLRLECNPWELGSDGVLDLLDGLHVDCR